MCGITGFIHDGARPQYGVKDRKDYMRQSLIVDSLRGFHSTGVFHAEHGSDSVGWAKACEQGASFVDNKMYVELETDMADYKFFVGHNRWATTGDADDVNNAHPFQEGDVTLVHNGTLDGLGGLITPQAVLEVDVDSHAICHNLALHDAKDVIEALDGAFTLIWHDKRDNSLNMVRNLDRPLCTWKSTHGNTMYFASEKGMLQWILDRNNITTASGSFEQLPAGELWKFKEGSLEPERTKLDLAPTWQQQYYGGGNYHMHGGSDYGKKSQTAANGTGGTGNRRVGMITDNACGVPTVVNDRLNKEGFDRTDRFPFVPMGRVGSISTGHIDFLDVAAFVIGITDHTSTSYFDKRWTVRPIGFREVAVKGDDTEVVVLCKIVSFSYHDTMWAYGQAWLEDDSAQSTVAPDETGGNPYLPVPALLDLRKDVDIYEDNVLPFDVPYSNETFVGPMGGEYSRSAWFEVTKDGCSICQQLPSSAHSDTLVWLDDGSDSFLCPPCAHQHLDAV